jgi:hypothetical protein
MFPAIVLYIVVALAYCYALGLERSLYDDNVKMRQNLARLILLAPIWPVVIIIGVSCWIYLVFANVLYDAVKEIDE